MESPKYSLPASDSDIKTIYEEVITDFFKLKHNESYDIGNNQIKIYIPYISKHNLEHFEHTIINIAKKTINEMANTVKISSGYDDPYKIHLANLFKKPIEDIKFDNCVVTQSAAHIVHFIMYVVNKYLSYMEPSKEFKYLAYAKTPQGYKIEKIVEQNEYHNGGIIITAHIKLCTIETCYDEMWAQIQWKSLKGHVYTKKDQKPEDKTYAVYRLQYTIIDIAKKIIKNSPIKFDISGKHHSSLGEGDVAQSAIYMAKFILAVVNKFFSNTRSLQRYKLTKIITNKMCKRCNLWYEPSLSCELCKVYDCSQHSSNDDDGFNDYCEILRAEDAYLHMSVIITAHIEKYIKED